MNQSFMMFLTTQTSINLKGKWKCISEHVQTGSNVAAPVFLTSPPTLTPLIGCKWLFWTQPVTVHRILLTHKGIQYLYTFWSIYKSPWMLHMYKNMYYIYIIMYTMCKTYGIQTTRGMGCWRRTRLGYNDGCKSTDECGELWCLAWTSTDIPGIYVSIYSIVLKSTSCTG